MNYLTDSVNFIWGVAMRVLHNGKTICPGAVQQTPCQAVVDDELLLALGEQSKDLRGVAPASTPVPQEQASFEATPRGSVLGEKPAQEGPPLCRPSLHPEDRNWADIALRDSNVDLSIPRQSQTGAGGIAVRNTYAGLATFLPGPRSLV